MGKIIVVICVCLLGAAFYFERSRTHILKYLDPVVAPFLEWSTKREMESIVRDLASEAESGRPVPRRQTDFARWMELNYEVGGDRDGWGSLYTYRFWPDSLGLISSGRDQEFATSDDLMVTHYIPRRRR